ncbi:lysosome membrane protein 2-like isoform X2 [Sabethes cyaneus]|uniref:lysosome membrane protein 2-like isoform X2 n=1 Tax=Sabethes cyaneus TaxID=53552 RepID=UPI00237EA9F9|nr:lysosome membrane protein 2-like isoform X2 [Sabethes cyaneus]
MTIAEQKSCTNRQQQGQLCNNIYPNQQVQQTMQNNNPQQNTYAINSSKPLKKQTSALDNIAFHLGIKDSDSDQANDRNLYVTLSLLGVLFIVFIASVTGFFVMWFTDVYDNSLLEKLKLSYNSTAAEWWERPPVNPLLKVHVFNYTNVEEFIKGEATKLKVVDLGPYVYHETAEKVNVSYNGDGTITYKERRSYQFLANQSSGMQYDKVVIPNVPMLTAVSKYFHESFYKKMILNTALNSVNAVPFKTLPVDSFLWGYEDELLNLAKKFSFDSEISFEKFGILMTRNGTSAETFTIYSGETDLKQLAIIKGLDGKSSLDLWTTDECNRVDGTDGSQFPPHLMDKRQTLYVFIKSLCRKFPLQYEKEVTLFDGIPAWRYKAPLDVFAHPNINVDNQCFCHLGSASCPLSGLLNATLCSYGAPIYASFPHFYTGDEKLLETVDGLHPQREKHETYADIHPRLAFPIDGASRFQINVQVKKTSYITALEKFEDGDILPVVWLEVVPGVISEELRNMIYHSTFSANAIQLSFKYGSLLICVTTLALLTMACYCRTKNSPHVTYSCNEQPTQKKESDGTQRLNSSNEMKNHDI